VVAIGAAVQAGVLAGDVKDLLLLDVTPLTLSIETLGGVATPMIPRNTTIPTKKTRPSRRRPIRRPKSRCTCCRASVPWRRRTARWASSSWAAFMPAPRGVPQIEVTFDIDANGILNVTAKDNATGKDTRITITSSSGLSKEEVEKMAKEAEAHAAEDKEKREEIEARNSLDGLVYNIEKMLKDSATRCRPRTRPRSSRRWPTPRRRSKARPSTSELKFRAREADPGQPQAGRGALQGQSRRWGKDCANCCPSIAGIDFASAIEDLLQSSRQSAGEAERRPEGLVEHPHQRSIPGVFSLGRQGCVGCGDC
jgi:molecular chaperone DnaK